MSIATNQNMIIKGLLVASAVIVIVLSMSASISGDEDIHFKYGDRIINFFTSLGEDKSYQDEVRGPDYAYNFTFDAGIELAQRATGYGSPSIETYVQCDDRVVDRID